MCTPLTNALNTAGEMTPKQAKSVSVSMNEDYSSQENWQNGKPDAAFSKLGTPYSSVKGDPLNVSHATYSYNQQTLPLEMSMNNAVVTGIIGGMLSYHPHLTTQQGNHPSDGCQPLSSIQQPHSNEYSINTHTNSKQLIHGGQTIVSSFQQLHSHEHNLTSHTSGHQSHRQLRHLEAAANSSLQHQVVTAITSAPGMNNLTSLQNARVIHGQAQPQPHNTNMSVKRS